MIRFKEHTKGLLVTAIGEDYLNMVDGEIYKGIAHLIYNEGGTPLLDYIKVNGGEIEWDVSACPDGWINPLNKSKPESVEIEVSFKITE